MRAIVLALGIGALSLGACASSADAPSEASASAGVHAANPTNVVDAFAAALRAGDAPALRRLMAPDVIIAEGGGAERSFDEYAGAHMPADMAFTAAVQSTLQLRDVIADGDMATVISRFEVHGEFRGRAIHARTMETMVLRRIDGDWRIVHIHWSSAPIGDAH